MSKTILLRLIVGLVGCAAIAAVFPFAPSDLRCEPAGGLPMMSPDVQLLMQAFQS